MMRRADRTTTRRQILALLCGGNRTSGELAEAIGISRSGVREHLDGLRREGLIEFETVIQGAGRPAHQYRLSRAGEGLLSRAYLPLAESLLGVLAARMGEDEVDEILHEVGRRLAERLPAPREPGDSRAGIALGMIEMLGGIAETETSPAGLTIRGRCCPVAAISSEHPQVCTAIERMLAAATGLPVREQCDRSGRPSCRFEISLPKSDA